MVLDNAASIIGAFSMMLVECVNFLFNRRNVRRMMTLFNTLRLLLLTCSVSDDTCMCKLIVRTCLQDIYHAYTKQSHNF